MLRMEVSKIRLCLKTGQTFQEEAHVVIPQDTSPNTPNCVCTINLKPEGMQHTYVYIICYV